MIHNKIKKIMAVLMLVVLFINILPSVCIFADYTGSCGIYVNYSFNPSTGVLTITGEGEMTDYSLENKAPWDSYKDNIKSVIICYPVANIGVRAFSHCMNLESVTIEEGNCAFIGDYAFSCCTSLKKLELPSSILDIGAHAFTHCSNLKSVTIKEGEGVSVGRYAFSCCTELKHVSDEVNFVADYAFYKCANLENIPLSCEAKFIGAHAFSHCESLDSINIGESVCSIGSYAFYCCTNLIDVTYWGSDKPNAGWCVFKGCSELKHIVVCPEYKGFIFCGVKTHKISDLPFLDADYTGEQFARWQQSQKHWWNKLFSKNHRYDSFEYDEY